MKSASVVFLLIVLNLTYSYAQNDLAEFLRALGHDKPDSTKIWNQTFYGNGKRRTESITYYSHFRPYPLNEFIKKDSITIIRKFRRVGTLKESAILFPAFQRSISKYFFNRNGRNVRSEYYDVNDNALFEEFQGKIKYIMDPRFRTAV